MMDTQNLCEELAYLCKASFLRKQRTNPQKWSNAHIPLYSLTNKDELTTTWVDGT